MRTFVFLEGLPSCCSSTTPQSNNVVVHTICSCSTSKSGCTRVAYCYSLSRHGNESSEGLSLAHRVGPSHFHSFLHLYRLCFLCTTYFSRNTSLLPFRRSGTGPSVKDFSLFGLVIVFEESIPIASDASNVMVVLASERDVLRP